MTVPPYFKKAPRRKRRSSDDLPSIPKRGPRRPPPLSQPPPSNGDLTPDYQTPIPNYDAHLPDYDTSTPIYDDASAPDYDTYGLDEPDFEAVEKLLISAETVRERAREKLKYIQHEAFGTPDYDTSTPIYDDASATDDDTYGLDEPDYEAAGTSPTYFDHRDIAPDYDPPVSPNNESTDLNYDDIAIEYYGYDYDDMNGPSLPPPPGMYFYQICNK